MTWCSSGESADAHGLRGHVIVSPETDFVDERFVSGATMWTRSDRGEEPLTINSARVQNGRPVVGFEGFAGIDAVERLSGLELRVPQESLPSLGDGAYYQHQLVGCSVKTVGGDQVGDVVRVDGGTGGSLLAIKGTRGEVLVPFARHICVDIDVAARRIVIDPPDGLLELNERN